MKTIEHYLNKDIRSVGKAVDSDIKSIQKVVG